MTIIMGIILFAVMLYCFVMYGVAFRQYLKLRKVDTPEADETLDVLSEYTFRLGLCGILAAGFLGLMAK